jgi:hypothetical protein
LLQRPPKSVYPDKCCGAIIAFKLIEHFSDARQAGTILSSDQPEIVAGLIPFIGMMLVLLLVYNARATDQGLVRRIYNLARYAERLATYCG